MCFSGIFYQGYECTRCQKKLHRECIKKIGTCFQRSNLNFLKSMKIIDVLFLASLERIRSFDRGSIELPRTLSNVNNHRMS